MNVSKKLTALLLCAALLLSLCGCLPDEEAGAAQAEPAQTAQDAPAPDEPSPETPAEAEPVETLAGGGYFDPVARPDISFADMDQSEITLDDFRPYAEALTTASASGSREAFHRACAEAQQQLLAINTAGTLAELASDQNAADQTLSDRASRQTQAYYDAVDLYNQTLFEISEGENSSVLSKEFEMWQIEYFKSYDAESSAQSLALATQESQLVRQYAALSSQGEMDYDAAADIFLELVSVRAELASLSGAANFSEYAYSAYYSRDYSPTDAQKLWKTAKEDFAPLLHKYADEVTSTLQSVQADGALDLSETAITDALCYGAARISPEVSDAAQYLLSHGLYDISDSDTKLSTGYTSYLYSYNVPFIYNCPYGSHLDYADLFHEFGHWLAGYYHGSDALYGVIDYDLSELQSQGMEVLFLQYYDEFFGENAQLLRAETLLNLVYSVVTGAMYDEFQQKVYLEPDLTKDRLLELFREVYESYGFESYDGCEYRWADIIHNFQQPLYYISYAVSAIPALELYVRSIDSPNDAADAYLRVASMSDEEFFLTDALREAGLANSMKSPIGDVIALKLEQSGAFDIS